MFRTLTFVICLGLASEVAAHDGAAPRWQTKAVSFRSADGVTLSGSLVTSQERPVAAVVLGPGASPGERYENLAALMALRGVVTLTYDKRGAGKSGGARGHVGDTSAANLALFASDAAAAMQWLSRDPATRALPRGFVAISQSGWVIPLALGRAPRVDFIGFWSGPTCTTSEQFHFQLFSEKRGYDRAKMTGDEIQETMRHVEYRQDDVDPVQSLKTISIPGLWLFGGRDPHVPVELSVLRLRELIDGGRSNFEYRVYPDEGHNLADSPDQESFVGMIDWIKRVATMKREQSTGPTEAQQGVPADRPRPAGSAGG